MSNRCQINRLWAGPDRIKQAEREKRSSTGPSAQPWSVKVLAMLAMLALLAMLAMLVLVLSISNQDQSSTESSTRMRQLCRFPECILEDLFRADRKKFWCWTLGITGVVRCHIDCWMLCSRAAEKMSVMSAKLGTSEGQTAAPSVLLDRSDETMHDCSHD